MRFQVVTHEIMQNSAGEACQEAKLKVNTFASGVISELIQKELVLQNCSEMSLSCAAH